jgi:ABC-type lipoprotein release transport system permease subunit
MTSRTLIKRSLRFYWRSHLGVVLGAAVGSAALIGALIVGDSVRESLRARALQRLGWIHVAMDLGDRLVAKTFYRGIFNVPSTNSAGVVHQVIQSQALANLHSSGTMAREDGTARANHVEVYGLQSRTFFLGPKWRQGGYPPDWLVVNEPLAEHLHVKPGDEVVLRVRKPSALSREAIISPQSDATASLRLKVERIARAEELGNFSLQQNQVPPFNAFLDLDRLNRALGTDGKGLEGKVNLMVGGAFQFQQPSSVASSLNRLGSGGQALVRTLNRLGFAKTRTNEFSGDFTAHKLNQLMPRNLLIEAAGLSHQHISTNIVDVRSSRIFLDPPVARTSTNISAPGITGTVPLLTYLVNALQAGTNLTPYSMVTAAGPPYTPANLKDDEIVLTDWLAHDLNVQPGAQIQLSYFLADSAAQLIERTNAFRVHSIVPVSGLYDDPTLMPDFPGIAKAESTHDWDAGFPLTHRIRPQDDTYWKEHRGTPKAYITLAAGQRMWGNRFGELTAVRWFMSDMPHTEQDKLGWGKLVGSLKASDFGIGFETVRDRALAAAEQSQDFGGLFIGFSFFLIIAALILMGLLFAFGLQQRAEEIGTLLALGFHPKQVRKIFLLEGAALAFIGSVCGVIGGIVYAKLMLRGLTTIWRGATNTSALTFYVSPLTIVIGLISGTLVAITTIWLVLRKQARQPARELLVGESRDELHESPSQMAGTRGDRLSKWKRFFSARWIAWASMALTIATLVAAFAMQQTTNPEYFFSAGSFALIAGLAFTSLWLRSSQDNETPSEKIKVSLPRLLRRAAGRRKSRSVATVALIASGVFLIASIGAFRLDADANAWKRSSGTGGFALIGESTLPIMKDLNTPEGRDALGLDEKILQGVSFVPFRVRDGDDASCLNLNRAQQPRLLGVNSDLIPYDAFSFVSALQGTEIKGGDRWEMLTKREFPNRALIPTNRIPAVGDAASIQWALHKKIGDTISYHDEHGEEFEAWLVGGLANSILQGSLIIDGAEFTRHFPSVSGYRMFLIDCPSNALPQVSAELTRALQDFGFEVTPAAQRLAAFNAVQNTYLNTFQVLGGLGLLLGSFGLGIVVLRNVLERRGELALLIAVGFRRARVQKLVLVEHAILLSIGLVIGVASALVAILPSLLSPRAELPVQSLALTLGGVLLFGLISTWLATRAAVRGNLLEGLRNE